jgi:predicted transcriptional regulator
MGYNSELGKKMRVKISAALAEGRKQYFEKMKEKKKESIYEIIRIYSNYNGISHNTLAYLSGLDRKSLRPYTCDLLNEGLIKRTSHGPYFPTKEYDYDPLIVPNIFEQIFRNKILVGDDSIILNESSTFTVYVKRNKMTDDLSNHPSFDKLEYDFTSYKRFYDPKFDIPDILEHDLFEFSNLIGGYITYMLIQAMNPDNMEGISSSKNKEALAHRWIVASISPILPFLLSRFKDVVYKAYGQYPKTKKEQADYQKRPRYVLEGEIIHELISVFTHLYPQLSFELEKVSPKKYQFERALKNSPSYIDNYKKQHEKLYRFFKEQENCKHEYGKSRKLFLGFVGQQCIICSHIKKVKKAELKSIRNKSKNNNIEL